MLRQSCGIIGVRMIRWSLEIAGRAYYEAPSSKVIRYYSSWHKMHLRSSYQSKYCVYVSTTYTSFPMSVRFKRDMLTSQDALHIIA